jgi:hypothetical protein
MIGRDHLSADARSVIAAAAGGDDPAGVDRDRVRARVLAAIAAGSVTGTAPPHAAATTTATAVGAKVVAIAVAAVVIAAVAYLAVGRGATTDTATPDRDVEVAVEAATATVAGEIATVAGATATAAPPEVVTPAPPRPARAPRAAATGPADGAIEIDREVEDAASAPPPATLRSADSLREERALVARANAALRDGDPRAALGAVAEHARRFPDGVLAEERTATRVVALCELGRVAEADRARASFAARWPRSVHAARVHAACAP